MKNKTIVILGAVFLLLVALYLTTSLNPPEKTKGAAPLFGGERPDIDKIELNSIRRGHIVLEKRNGLWYLTAPFEYKAFDSDVESMVNELLDTLVDGVVSSRSETRDGYSVGDSTGTSVKVSSAGNLILDAIVGRQSRDIGHSYARRAGSNDVEMWRGMFSQEVIKEADAWRDKMLYSFNRDDIITIAAEEGKTTRMLALPDSLWVYTENGKGKPVDQGKVRNFVALLAELKCDAFASDDDIPRAAEKAPDVTVTFTIRNGDRHSFDLWNADDLFTKYLVRKTGGNILYRFYKYRGSQLGINYEMLKPGQS